MKSYSPANRGQQAWARCIQQLTPGANGNGQLAWEGQTSASSTVTAKTTVNK